MVGNRLSVGPISFFFFSPSSPHNQIITFPINKQETIEGNCGRESERTGHDEEMGEEEEDGDQNRECEEERFGRIRKSSRFKKKKH